MLHSILVRTHDAEGLPISKTNLRVKMKTSKKTKSKESKPRKENEETQAVHRRDMAKDKPNGCAFLQVPVEDRLRRRLSDQSLQLEKHSPPRVRRRSVSFDPFTVFKTAILENDVDTAKNVLISGKVSANTSVDGVLPVVLAAKDGCAECLELLIENGGQIDVTDKHGFSPLELAVREGHFDCAQVLISAGANANSIRDGYFDESIESANRAHARSRSRTF